MKEKISKRCIIIGASSGIGYEVAKLLLQDGWYIGVAARRMERLESLRSMAPERVFARKIDVCSNTATADFNALITALGGVDLLFYAAGIGWQNKNLEEEKELRTMETNALAFTKMIGTAFRYFEKKGGGHIMHISSIAGTKGLAPAPAYSASKALQNTYIQALEQLANSRKLNIHFTDIRPGFVDTELLSGTHFPLLMNPKEVAKKIIKAIYSQKHIIVIDWKWRIITAAWRMIPNVLWRRIKL